jgi:hypothetical protein
LSGSDDSTRRRRPRRPRHPDDDPLSNLAHPGNVWVAHWRKEGRSDDWIINRVEALAEADGPPPRTPFGTLDIIRLTERQLLWLGLRQRLKAYANRHGMPQPAAAPALPSAAAAQPEPLPLDSSTLPVPKGKVPAGTPSSTALRAAAAANFAARTENQGRGQRWLYEKYKRLNLWPRLNRDEFPKQPKC